MQSLYQTAVDKKNAYDAAMAGYQSAAIAKNVADQKYRLNMLSRSDYLEAELTYLQKKAARDSANIAFYEALKAYEWAVDGFTDIE